MFYPNTLFVGKGNDYNSLGIKHGMGYIGATGYTEPNKDQIYYPLCVSGDTYAPEVKNLLLCKGISNQLKQDYPIVELNYILLNYFALCDAIPSQLRYSEGHLWYAFRFRLADGESVYITPDLDVYINKYVSETYVEKLIADIIPYIIENVHDLHYNKIGHELILMGKLK